jgi:hypothetical protein
MRKLLLEPRQACDFQLIAIAEEVFGVTDNDMILLDENSPSMADFVKKHGEIGYMVLMEAPPKSGTQDHVKTFINPANSIGLKFLRFLGEQHSSFYYF